MYPILKDSSKLYESDGHIYLICRTKNKNKIKTKTKINLEVVILDQNLKNTTTTFQLIGKSIIRLTTVQ